MLSYNLDFNSCAIRDGFRKSSHKLVMTTQESTATNPPTLPRKRKAPQRFEVGSGEGYHSSTVEEYYMQHYYEALDSAISTIENRFDQPGYIMYCNLESLLIKAACQQDFAAAEFQKVTDFYA